MNISAIHPTDFFPDAKVRSEAPEQTADRLKLVQAIKALNDSNAMGEKNELTFVFDRSSHRTLVRVIDRDSHEVVMQIPSEDVLRLADQLRQDSAP